MTEIKVSSFGHFELFVDGTRVTPPQSKAARELIVRAAIQPGALTREYLADALWPNETDMRRARRNLTRELNRAQEAVGGQLWLGSRNTVRTSGDVVFVSDIAEALGCFAGGKAPKGVDAEHFVAILMRGEFLPGHETEWVQSIRYQLAAITDKWQSEQERLKSSERLRAQPTEYELTEGASTGLARREGTVLQPGRHVCSKIERARRDLGKAKLEGDEGRLLQALGELDDLLRLSGRTRERRQLWSDPGFAVPGTAWRRAETAQMSGDRRKAASILEESTPIHATDNDRLQLAAADAASTCAIDKIRGLLEPSTPGNIRREAGLRMAFVLYQTSKLRRAEDAATQVLIEAEQAGDEVLSAHASSTLGWILLETDDNRRAEFHLNEALSAARQCGADQVRASALAGIGALHDRQHRYASAVAATELAIAITSGLGNVPLEGRYRMNLATGALKAGLWEIATEQLDWIDRTMSPESVHEPPTTAISAALPGDWVQTLRYRLDWVRGCRDLALQGARTLLERWTESNYSQAHACRVDLIEMLISSGLAEEAVQLASSSMNTRCPNHTNTVSLVETACLGAALIAAGSAERGGSLIRKSSDLLRVVDRIPTFVLVQARRAADETTAARERHLARAEATYRFKSIQADLSGLQWKRASQRVSAIADLARGEMGP